MELQCSWLVVVVKAVSASISDTALCKRLADAYTHHGCDSGPREIVLTSHYARVRSIYRRKQVYMVQNLLAQILDAITRYNTRGSHTSLTARGNVRIRRAQGTRISGDG